MIRFRVLNLRVINQNGLIQELRFIQPAVEINEETYN